MQGQTINNTLVPAQKVADFATRTQISGVIPVDDTIPQNTEGTQIFSESITLKSTSSKVIIDVFLDGAVDVTSTFVMLAAFRGSNADAVGSSLYRFQNVEFNQARLFCIDSPATTGSVTYSIRAGVNANNLYINGNSSSRFLGGSMKCTLKLTEILP